MENKEETLDYYGAEGSTDTRHLRERLRDFYDEGDFVNIINTDTKSLKYQFMNPVNMEDASTAAGKYVIMHKPPTVVILQPGQTKLCPAFEADLMLEALIKQITSTKTLDRVAEGTIGDAVASTDWSSFEVQNAIVKQAFLGKEDILGRNNDEPIDITKDLDIEPDREPAKVGRPRKEE